LFLGPFYTMSERIYIENGQVFTETVNKTLLGTEAAILSTLAAKGQLSNLGKMFKIENALSFIEGQPETKDVTVLDATGERIYVLNFNSIPWTEYWKLAHTERDGVHMRPSIFKRRSRSPGDDMIKKDVSFNIPWDWGQMLMFIDCRKEGPNVALNEIYLVFKPNTGDTIYKTALPNNYPDTRICLGDISRREKDEFEPALDQNFVKFLWEYVWESNFNEDLSYNIDWMKLDQDMNPIQPETTFGNERAFVDFLREQDEPEVSQERAVMRYVSLIN